MKEHFLRALQTPARVGVRGQEPSTCGGGRRSSGDCEGSQSRPGAPDAELLPLGAAEQRGHLIGQRGDVGGLSVLSPGAEQLRCLTLPDMSSRWSAAAPPGLPAPTLVGYDASSQPP